MSDERLDHAVGYCLVFLVIMGIAFGAYMLAGVQWSEPATVTSVGDKVWNSQTLAWNYSVTVQSATHGTIVLTTQNTEPQDSGILGGLEPGMTIAIWLHPDGVYGMKL